MFWARNQVVFCCFASVTKAYHLCLAGLLAARCCKKIENLKCLDFSRDPEGKLGIFGYFWGFLLLCFGHEISWCWPFRKRHKGISFLLGGLVGCKMLLGKAEMSRF